MKKLYLSKHKNGYYYIYYNDDNGRRQSITTKTKIKSEALKVISNFDEIIKEKNSVDPKHLTLKQFRWIFLKHSESYHSWKTTLDYKSTFNEMEEHFGNILLTEFTQQSIEEFIQMKIMKRSLHTGRRHLINIKAMFNKAVAYGYLGNNPANNIKRIKPPERLPIFFTEQEFKKLLKKVRDKDWRDIIEFAVNTGLRQMEILNLHKTQFNQEDRLIILDNQYHTTKSRKIRNIPLNSKAFEIVSRRIRKRGDLIFTLKGERILQDNLQDKFRKYVKAAGVHIQKYIRGKMELKNQLFSSRAYISILMERVFSNPVKNICIGTTIWGMTVHSNWYARFCFLLPCFCLHYSTNP